MEAESQEQDDDDTDEELVSVRDIDGADSVANHTFDDTSEDFSLSNRFKKTDYRNLSIFSQDPNICSSNKK